MRGKREEKIRKVNKWEERRIKYKKGEEQKRRERKKKKGSEKENRKQERLLCDKNNQITNICLNKILYAATHKYNKIEI